MASTSAVSYHWTPASQRCFIEVLAETGSVQRACKSVSMSRAAAYGLRRRDTGLAFRLGWSVAAIIARDMLVDQFMMLAMTSVEQIGVRHPKSRRMMWRNSNPLLGPGKGMALLNRLDSGLARSLANPHETALVHVAGQNFDALLELIGRGGDLRALATFIVRRGGAKMRPYICKLMRKSDVFLGGI